MSSGNKFSNEGSSETIINMESEHAEIEEQPKKEGNLKKRLAINPAKAVIQSASAVKGGISQMDKGLNDINGKLTKVPGISQGMSIFADYRKFLDRGNVVDLAVAVVIDSLVKDIVAPILALASGRALEENFVVLRRNASFPNPDYSTRASVKASDALSWNYGNFIQTVINFFIISACVFVIVKLLLSSMTISNMLVYQMGRNTKVDITDKKCNYCSGTIALNAVRCPKCTTWLDLDVYAKSEAEMAMKLKYSPMFAPPPDDHMNY
ncbi:hypothetical protein BGZ46_004831 [Entomortierella lignicola]|nr:hypothetical protein BGZ46_004831 [Entomortierella lignicola]